jgi:mannosyltransferase
VSRSSLYALPLLLFGVYLRFHALERQSLWDDEMSTLQTISMPNGAILERFATYETHPPLYFLQLKVWRAMGLRSLVKLRANSAFWGSLSLILIYMVARLYGGETAGLLGLGLLSLSPFHLAYSQELRPYAMAMAISLGALFTLERRSWVLLGFLWTALLYTHYWGAFVVLAQAVYGWTTARSENDKKAVLASAGAAALLFAPWLPILRAQLGVVNGLAFWVPAFSVANLGKVFLAYAGLLFNMASWTFYLRTTIWVLVIIGIAFAGVFVKGIVSGPRAAIWWLAVGLGVPWLLSLWKPAIFVWYRYPILMLPAFAILVAAGLLGIKPRAIQILVTVMLLSSQIWGTWTYFHHWQKANPEAVVRYIHWLKKPATVVVRPSYFAALFGFYDQGTTPALDEHLMDSPTKRASLKGKDILLVAFDVPSDPVADAFLNEFETLTARYFPGTAHLGITVYQLK